MTCCFTNSVRLTYVEFKIKRVSKTMCIVELVQQKIYDVMHIIRRPHKRKNIYIDLPSNF